MALDNQFGKGIGVAAGFDLGAQKPLDARVAVNTIAERDAHVENNRAYEGMLVYVSETSMTYQLVKGEEEGQLVWKEFGFNQSDFDESFDGAIQAVDNRLKAVEEDLAQGGETEGRIAQAESDIDGLQGLVGKPAEGEEAATGLHLALDNAKEELAQAIATEKSRAEGKEGELAQAIATEVSRAEGVEGELTQAIAAEKSRAESVEGELQGQITALKGDGEGSVPSQITAAKNELKGAIDKVQDNLDNYKDLMETTSEAEKTATSEAIQAVQNAVDTEVTKRGEEITRVEGLITTEKGRAEGVEAAIRQELANEKAALQAEIDSDVKVVADELAKQKDARQEGTLAHQIATEVSRAKGQEAAIRQEMTNEATRVNQKIADDIAAEATLRKNADDALDGRLQAVEASIGDGGNLEGRVAANEAKLAGLEKDTVKAEIQAAQAAAEKHADDAITALVDSAPDAMNTLNELAKAIKDHGDVYTAYVQEHATAMATMKSDLQAEIDTDVKVVADELAKQKDDKQEGTLAHQIATEVSRAEGKERDLQGQITALKGDGEGSVSSQITAAKNELKGQIDGVQDALDDYKELINGTIASDKTATSEAIQVVQNAVDTEAKTRGDKDKELEDAIKVLNGNAETEGSVAKAVAAEAKSREEADTALDGKISKLRTDMVETFNALDLNWVEGATPKIEIKLDPAKTGFDTVLGDVEVPVMTDEEVSEMLTALGLN